MINGFHIHGNIEINLTHLILKYLCYIVSFRLLHQRVIWKIQFYISHYIPILNVFLLIILIVLTAFRITVVIWKNPSQYM